MELKPKITNHPGKFLGNLLIVPYGIETAMDYNSINFVHLLIVPYGIETDVLALTLSLTRAFNRTLWN